MIMESNVKKTLGKGQTGTSRRINPEKLLPKIEGIQGAVCPQWKRCGKPRCRCAKGSLHGPYYYHFWYVDGKLRKKYIRKSNVEAVSAACKASREQYRRFRDAINWCRNNLTQLSESLREVSIP